MKSAALPSLVLSAALAALAARGATAQGDPWAGYLDYAYVYSSAEPQALTARLAEYGREAGLSLGDYIARQYASGAPPAPELDEVAVRRRAIAYFLQYLATAEPDALDASAAAIGELKERLGRHENRYWYHTILAHRALEKGQRYDFVGEVLELWLRVVVPLESPYETLQTLSLSESPNSGFASALPYIFENLTRLILIRSQQMGMDRGLDPLSAIVRLLADGRVGAHPDVIPPEASSREYLKRIVSRLDGPESDGGSLTFTLALFEASKYHDRARSLLASQGLEPETLKAIRVTAGAYETALNRADTLQGQCAVYGRALRQLGELYAAKQRLGVDPDIETPFSIEGAIEVYSALQRSGDDWQDAGYASTGRQSYLDALHGLWEEIQEASLNSADYYLARSVESPHLAGDYSRDAARIYSRYLALFYEFATAESHASVPDSAYFTAYEAAKGFGDAFMAYAPRPTPAEIDLASQRYRSAIRLFPFDRELWSGLTRALERHGRESEYLSLVSPIAESVAKSRHVDAWIEKGEPGAEQIATLRRALSDNLVIMYLGFADASGIDELERSLVELRTRRAEVEGQLAALNQRLQEPAPGSSALPAAPDGAAEGAPPPGLDAVAYGELSKQARETAELLDRIDKQIAARSRALPFYRETLEIEDLAAALRAQRDHPVHTLLRRMYHENRS